MKASKWRMEEMKQQYKLSWGRRQKVIAMSYSYGKHC